MCALHYEDYIGPADQLWRYRVFSVVVEASRTAFDVLARRKDLLGGWASQAILAANEEYALHEEKRET